MRSYLILSTLFAAAGLVNAQTCAFSINPNSASFSAAGGQDTVTITLTSGPSSCTRTVTSNASWITVSFGSPGTGSGSAGYTVQPNPGGARSGTLTVANNTFTVSQAAGSCTYSLSASTANVSAAGGSGSFNLNVSSTTCPWTVSSSSPDWLAITSGGSGTGGTTIRYTASPNPFASSRTATIAVAGQSVTVTQSGSCTFTLNPSAVTVPVNGGTGSIGFQASVSTCTWTAVSNADWIVLSGVTNGTGSGTANYTAAPNSTAQDRTGSVNIGGSSVSFIQPGSSCTFAFSNSGQSFPSSGGPGSFGVSGVCPWTATSSASWISVTSGMSTSGPGTVFYLVAANTEASGRAGSINVGGQSYPIQQTGVACSVSLPQASGSAPASGANGTIRVSAAGGCTWTAAASVSWISFSNASGTGEGDIAYVVSPNTTTQPRSGVITVANQNFMLTQEAASCTFQITPAQAAFPAAGGSGTIHIGTACSWAASATAPWISLAPQRTLTGTGSADVAYTVAANGSSEARSAAIQISGESVTISQSGKDCTIGLSTNGIQVPGRGGTAIVQVTGSKGCRWEPQSDSPWVTFPTWSAVDGSGSVTIAAAANPTPDVRYAKVTIAGEPVVIAQGQLEVLVTSVVNAASFATGAIAPGEIVTLFGSGMGPQQTVMFALSDDGQHIASTLAGIQVLFGDTPAPLIYVSDQQVSAIVPYSVPGATTQLRVSNQGVLSDPLPVNVAAASPAIFTSNASGRGQGAVLNQDNSINSVSNAAARNSVIQIFATGEGQTDPAGEDGRIANATLPKPRLAVTVQIGGQAATVLYAGAAPGAVAGLMQVNARIPQNVTIGNSVPVLVRVGQSTSPAGVTIAVK